MSNINKILLSNSKSRRQISSINKYSINTPISNTNQNNITTSSNYYKNIKPSIPAKNISYSISIQDNTSNEVTKPKIIQTTKVNSLSLEDIYKKQNLSDEVFIKIKFMKRKLGDAQTLGVLKVLDKANNTLSKENLNEELIKLIGKQGLIGIEQTLSSIVKASGFKFK